MSLQKRLSGTVVCVDPGKHALGISVWQNRNFRTGEYFRGNRFEMMAQVMGFEPDLVVCECPLVYPHERHADPNDLIQVGLSVGAVVAACEVGVTVYPSQWKGQVPKKIHHARIEPLLTLPMRVAVSRTPQGEQHNLLDAIALGLWIFSGDKKGEQWLAGTEGFTW